MSEQLMWFVGNRNPSITETITSDGVAVNLTGMTVRFKMRAVGSATLKVDQPATIVSAPAGTVRYDWAAIDVDTAGQYLVWWEVTSGVKTQDVAEAVIEIREHSNSHVYVELEQFKATTELTGKTFADQDIRLALSAASRAIDNACRRRFYPDPDALQVRYYQPTGTGLVLIDDLVTLTSLLTDPNGTGSFDYTWVLNSDFTLGPDNADALGRPWESISVHPYGDYTFPTAYGRGVKVTGKFGWAAPPDEVVIATEILASKLVKRLREAPLGVAAIGIDGAAIRIARTDPDVPGLIGPYVRSGLGMA